MDQEREASFGNSSNIGKQTLISRSVHMRILCTLYIFAMENLSFICADLYLTHSFAIFIVIEEQGIEYFKNVWFLLGFYIM